MEVNPSAQTVPPFLTRVYRRSDGDAAPLRVEGELVDVHLAGADHFDVLLIRDHPLVGHVHVRVLRGVVLLDPETQQHTPVHVCGEFRAHRLIMNRVNM